MLFAKVKNGFRWAVCQIDVLQRLEGERKIVRGALANLPKDLYETYDRETIEVPEDEQIFVQHALIGSAITFRSMEGKEFREPFC